MKHFIRIQSKRAALIAIAALFISAFAIRSSFAGASDGINGVGVGLGKKPNPSAMIVAKGTTDAKGNVIFPNVPPGEYELVIITGDTTRHKVISPKKQFQSSAVNTSRSNIRNNDGVLPGNPNGGDTTGTTFTAPAGHGMILNITSAPPGTSARSGNGTAVTITPAMNSRTAKPNSTTGNFTLSPSQPVTIIITTSGSVSLKLTQGS